MKSFRITVIFALALVLGFSSGLAKDRPTGWDDDGYNSYSPFDVMQTKDVPAGFVNEPGSELIYLLDTGINAEEMFGDDADYTINTLEDYGYTEPVHQNFISITNTNPSHAVTVHFRYFNSDCVDFFDFLVVLTCNDTMMIDPFDFVVPGTDNVNVKDRFFTGDSFDAIPASTFADGRFLLFVTASADIKYDYQPTLQEVVFGAGSAYVPYYDYGNLDLIPYEFISYREEELNVHCAAWEEGGGEASDPDYDDAGEELFGSYNAYGNSPGFDDDNLHILNASAVSFNYLVGFQTVAKVTDLGDQAAYMTQAFARPAVVTGEPQREWSITGGPSGVHYVAAPIHVVLSGGEFIYTEAAQQGTTYSRVEVVDNFGRPDGWSIATLRQEAHAGDQWDRGETTNGVGGIEAGNNWVISEGGALGWEVFPIAAMPAENQIVNFFSFMDNYNGLSNLAQGAQPSVWDDVSYNIQPVVTIYTIEPYNNSEDLWVPGDPEDQPIVSPVTPESPLTSAIAVKCINTYQIDPESNLNDAVLGEKFGEYTLQDLFDMNDVLGSDNLNLEGFMGVLAGSDNELANEVGPGWIRFSRWFTTRKWTTTDLTPVYNYSYWQGWEDPPGTPYFAPIIVGPSIFTAGQANFVFENFGAGKWLSTAAGYSRAIPERMPPL